MHVCAHAELAGEDGGVQFGTREGPLGYLSRAVDKGGEERRDVSG